MHARSDRDMPRHGRRRLGNVGNVVDMDEMIGNIHVRAVGVIREAVPGRRIVWQLRALVAQPVRLALDLEDDATGVKITHTIRAGFSGFGQILDPLLRLLLLADVRPCDGRARADGVRSPRRTAPRDRGRGDRFVRGTADANRARQREASVGMTRCGRRKNAIEVS
jgi:hypothetical protein